MMLTSEPVLTRKHSLDSRSVTYKRWSVCWQSALVATSGWPRRFPPSMVDGTFRHSHRIACGTNRHRPALLVCYSRWTSTWSEPPKWTIPTPLNWIRTTSGACHVFCLKGRINLFLEYFAYTIVLSRCADSSYHGCSHVPDSVGHLSQLADVHIIGWVQDHLYVRREPCRNSLL